MKRLLTVDPVACLALALASMALIVRSIVVVCQNYFIILFWDQWDTIDDFIHREATTKSWTYLFKPHNEHVIATSKILFALDWVLFHFTNLPLVLSTVFFAFVVAWLLATLVFWEQQRSMFFWTIWLIFSASGLSLAQSENLLCGFQVQFNLVLTGALASIIIALRVPTTDSPKGFLWLAALQLAMGFCAFSMANGIAIPVSVLFLLILFRAPLLKCLVTAGFGIFYAATYFLLNPTPAPDSALSPKTPFDTAQFFLTMTGGAPFDAEIHLAAILGAVVFATLAAFFVRYLALPWFRDCKADPGIAGLFALAVFLLTSAAGAAWARAFGGVDLALASRYATPMLVLWMVLFAVPVRLCLTSQMFPSNALFRRAALWLAIMAAFGTVAVSTLRATDQINGMMAISRSARQAAYFAASGVPNADEFKVFSYYTDQIKSHIAFLRRRRLNIFSPWAGLPEPPADEIRKLSFVSSIRACTNSYIDDTTRIDSNSWKVSGWISNANRHTPRWILASDGTGRLLGFTVPLVLRSDVERVLGAHHFRGFLLPFRILDSAQRPYFVVATFQDGEAACRLPLPNPLPRQ